MSFETNGAAELVEHGLNNLYVGLHTGDDASVPGTELVEALSNGRFIQGRRLNQVDLADPFTAQSAPFYKRSLFGALVSESSPRSILNSAAINAFRKTYPATRYGSVIDGNPAISPSDYSRMSTRAKNGRWPVVRSVGLWDAETGGSLILSYDLPGEADVHAYNVTVMPGSPAIGTWYELTGNTPGYSIAAQSARFLLPAASATLGGLGGGTLAQLLAALMGPVMTLTLSFHSALVPTVANKLTVPAPKVGLRFARDGNALKNQHAINYPSHSANIAPPAGWALSKNTDDFLFYGKFADTAPTIMSGNAYSIAAGAIAITLS